MSDTSQGPGWWIASDDKWYAPELHHDPEYRAQWAPPPIPPPSTPETSDGAPPLDTSGEAFTQVPEVAEPAEATVIETPVVETPEVEMPEVEPDAAPEVEVAQAAPIWSAPEVPAVDETPSMPAPSFDAPVADMPPPTAPPADIPAPGPLPSTETVPPADWGSPAEDQPGEDHSAEDHAAADHSQDDVQPDDDVPPVFVEEPPAAAFEPTAAIPLVTAPPDPTTMQPPVVPQPAPYAPPAADIPPPAAAPGMLQTEVPPTAWPQYGTPEVAATGAAVAAPAGAWGRLTGLVLLAAGVLGAFSIFLDWYRVGGLIDAGRRVTLNADGWQNNYGIPAIIAAVILGGVGGAKLVGASNKVMRFAGIVGALVLLGTWVVAYVDLIQQRDDLINDERYLSVHIWAGPGLWYVGIAGVAAVVAAVLSRD